MKERLDLKIKLLKLTWPNMKVNHFHNFFSNNAMDNVVQKVEGPY